jgi:hypothetical protein
VPDYREVASLSPPPKPAIRALPSITSAHGVAEWQIQHPELSERWAKFLMAHPEYSPVPGR